MVVHSHACPTIPVPVPGTARPKRGGCTTGQATVAPVPELAVIVCLARPIGRKLPAACAGHNYSARNLLVACCCSSCHARAAERQRSATKGKRDGGTGAKAAARGSNSGSGSTGDGAAALSGLSGIAMNLERFAEHATGRQVSSGGGVVGGGGLCRRMCGTCAALAAVSFRKGGGGRGVARRDIGRLCERTAQCTPCSNSLLVGGRLQICKRLPG